MAMSEIPKGGEAIAPSPFVKYTLISITLIFLALFLVMPMAAVLTEALRKGLWVALETFEEEPTQHAIKLTLTVAAIAVVCNLTFGIAAAWTIARFRFRGRNLLLTLIDLPFAVSPVISGLVFVLLFGRGGWFWPQVQEYDFKVIFAVPGIVLATLFVTFPLVARELIPLMQEQGDEEEQAALVLGAGRFQLFWRVTLPNVRWALLYGVILANARAMGEFGAVSVVSGHIAGRTNTMPLHVEMLYNEYNFTAAFSVAGLLMLLAVVTLIVKTLLEWKISRQRQAVQAEGAVE